MKARGNEPHTRRMDREELTSLVVRSLVIFMLVGAVTYLIAWDDGSPLYAGDSDLPALCLWGFCAASGLGLVLWGRHRLRNDEIHRGRPAEVVTWGRAILLGLAAFIAICVVGVIYVLSVYGS
jgi:hypothetical protein